MLTAWRPVVAAGLVFAAIAGLVYSVLSMAGGDPRKRIIPGLDRAQREAIVAAANQAIHQHLKAERNKEQPDEIDPRFWGDAIARLKPIRVYSDRVNVAIVLSEMAGVEDGLYVSVMISSHRPEVGDRFALFEPLGTVEDPTFRTLYHYKIRPKIE